jgi:peptide methionine sulfoxide reductase MsrB
MGCTQSSSAEGSVVETPNSKEANFHNSYPVYGAEEIMSRKGHGTYSKPVQRNLLYGCDFQTADRICNYNRSFAEHAGYFTSGKRNVPFLEAIQEAKKQKNKSITFYDSNTGKPLFTAPVNRTWDEWLKESKAHGWPSFRDAEVNWDHVRTLRNGEAVSVHGTHLGHNLPDSKGNRYCINLVSVAGNAVTEVELVNKSREQPIEVTMVEAL